MTQSERDFIDALKQELKAAKDAYKEASRLDAEMPLTYHQHFIKLFTKEDPIHDKRHV